MVVRARAGRLAVAVGVTTALTLTAACSGVRNQDDGAGSGESVSLRYSSFITDAASESRAATWFFDKADELATEHTLDVETFYSGTLLAPDATLSGLSGGRAETALFAGTYAPNEMPLSQIVTVPFISQSGEAVARALADMYEENDAFREEYERQGVVPLLWSNQDNTVFGFRDPVRTSADFSGRQIRAVGLTAEAIGARGGAAVALASPEIYESLQQGVLDGFGSLPFDNAVNSFRLQEVAPHFVDTGMGQHTLVVSVLMSEGAWEGLPDDVRDAMELAADEALDASVEMRAEDGAKACEALKSAGGDIVALDEEQVDSWRSEVQQPLLDQWRAAAIGSGLEEQVVDDFLDEYRSAVAGYEADAAPDAMTQCAEG
jgi:TRAP-type C4-dicarboxylate transport system substrate-binding protein